MEPSLFKWAIAHDSTSCHIHWTVLTFWNWVNNFNESVSSYAKSYLIAETMTMLYFWKRIQAALPKAKGSYDSPSDISASTVGHAWERLLCSLKRHWVNEQIILLFEALPGVSIFALWTYWGNGPNRHAPMPCDCSAALKLFLKMLYFHHCKLKQWSEAGKMVFLAHTLKQCYLFPTEYT